MPFRAVLMSLGTASTLAATSLVAGHAPAPLVATAATPAAATRMEAREQVDDAVAASVIGSIARQFDADSVVVQLDHVAMQPASVQDREVSGDGRLRIGDDDAWIPFRFAAAYDTDNAEATFPRVELGGGNANDVATGSPLAKSLDRQVASALHAEFQSQPVTWTASRIQATDLGRYVRVSGTGTANFGADGDAPAQVQGLYDDVSKRWVRVHYELSASTESGVASL